MKPAESPAISFSSLVGSSRTIALTLGRFGSFLLVIFTVVFLATGVIPIDPARALLGALAPEGEVARARRELGLDAPLVSRYLAALPRALQGDFGVSIYYRRPAGDILLEEAPRTLLRSVAALGVGSLGAIILVFGLPKHGRLSRLTLAAVQAMPPFSLMLLILVMAGLLAGVTPLAAPVLFEGLLIFGAALYSLASLSLFLLERLNPTGPAAPTVEFLALLHAPRSASIRLQVRNSMPAFVLVAFNGLAPTITAVSFGEIVFNSPGFGLLFFRSCARGDLPIVAGGTLWLAALLLTLQLASELLVSRFDPRMTAARPA